MRLIIGIVVSVIAISAAILGPTVIKDGIENYQELREIQAREFACDAWVTGLQPKGVFKGVDRLGYFTLLR